MKGNVWNNVMNGKFTPVEEIAHGITHGVAALLSIAGLVVLIVLASIYGTAWHVIGFTIFGTTLVILYLASTLYHSLSFTPARNIFNVIDHSAIFLLIAGTYTPFLLVGLRSFSGWFFFGVIWGLAVVGILLKCIFAAKFRKIFIVLYIIMGWLCLLSLKGILIHICRSSILLLLFGGLAYTTGLVFYAWKKLPFNHFIWHMFVLCGSICHYFSLFFCL